MDMLSLINAGLDSEGKLGKVKRAINKSPEASEINGVNKADQDQMRAEFKRVARDMESLFAYQLIKIMRETSDAMSAEKKGHGYNTYMSMFDMEISKLFADKGLGLQQPIIELLERKTGAYAEKEIGEDMNKRTDNIKVPDKGENI